MISAGAERCSVLGSLTIVHRENVKVEIKNFVLCQTMAMLLSDEILPDFNHVVIEIDMSINQGVETRLQSAYQGRLSNIQLKDSFVSFQIKHLENLISESLFSLIPDLCDNEEIHSLGVNVKGSDILEA